MHAGELTTKITKDTKEAPQKGTRGAKMNRAGAVARYVPICASCAFLWLQFVAVFPLV
jgi:hypothetical protein